MIPWNLWRIRDKENNPHIKSKLEGCVLGERLLLDRATLTLWQLGFGNTEELDNPRNRKRDENPGNPERDKNMLILRPLRKTGCLQGT